MTEDTPLQNPAESLAGRSLDDDWTVVEKLPRPPQATGGHFSISYAVESGDGRRGFLKALDYSAVFQQADVPRALEAMTSAYNFERDLLYRCAPMSRIVTALADGEIRDTGWTVPVNYLIFEWADQDSRAVLDAAQRIDVAWALRTLHQVAVGLSQLHGSGIAHQDLKPSNVLDFGGAGSKLADLGRSSYRGNAGPSDHLPFPGDWTYAPPELLYGQVNPDWSVRRFASDLYQLGSLATFFFTGTGMTGGLLAHLDSRHAPQDWAGTYEDVLPFVRQAFSDVMGVMESSTPADLKADLVGIVRELCEPEPALRGHPKNRVGHTNRYGLERYVSRLNLLARRYELGLVRVTS